MKAFKCDKCKKFYELPETEHTKVPVLTEWGIEDFDICPSCSEKIYKWLNSDFKNVEGVIITKERAETFKDLKEALMNEHTIEIKENGESTITYIKPYAGYKRIILFEKLIDNLIDSILMDEEVM